MKRALLLLPVLALLGYAGYRYYQPQKQQVLGAVYFFPKANVYYSVGTGEYMYFSPEKGSWVRDDRFTEEQKLSLGEKAEIDAPAEPVWEKNAEHRLLYSISLYAKNNDLHRKLLEDSLSSIPKKEPVPAVATKPASEAESADEEKKSGIRRFFENLFKGKKKEEKTAKAAG